MLIENFKQGKDIIITGHGETIEICFANVAQTLFSLMYDIKRVHFIQIITFEFEEDSIERALLIWLNLLLAKSREHQLIFGDFRLKRDNKRWKATVSGEKGRTEIEENNAVTEAKAKELSIKKIEHSWEVRCVLDMD